MTRFGDGDDDGHTAQAAYNSDAQEAVHAVRSACMAIAAGDDDSKILHCMRWAGRCLLRVRRIERSWIHRVRTTAALDESASRAVDVDLDDRLAAAFSEYDVAVRAVAAALDVDPRDMKVCFSKKRCETEADARDAAEESFRKWGKPQHPYKCPVDACGGWHLTSRPRASSSPQP